jgi:hypothetical protein
VLDPAGTASASLVLVLVVSNPPTSIPSRCSVSLSAAIKVSPLAEDVTDDRSVRTLDTVGSGLAAPPVRSEDEIGMLDSSAINCLGWLLRDADPVVSGKGRYVE